MTSRQRELARPEAHEDDGAEQISTASILQPVAPDLFTACAPYVGQRAIADVEPCWKRRPQVSKAGISAPGLSGA